ncbi:MAG: cell division control protein Cdc6, partial [Candidatus Nezhaarchaeales archaeon]
MELREVVFKPSVFKDEGKLDIHYVPPRLPHREEQLRQLLALFSSVLTAPGSKACRALLIGGTGTGKTA